MSNTIQNTLGTFTGFTITLNSLASATYVAATAVDLGTPTPIDTLLELVITPGTVSGNKQALLFVQVSLDGTNYSTGPTSGTTTTDQPNLFFVGTLPLNSSSTQQRDSWSLLTAIGFSPRFIKPVVLNDSGAAFAGSGNSCSYVTVVGTFT